ncbi:hypothetical protein B0T17DRAFT_616979 [Bombardia bombarda]|uniref:Uncharacterized protein n=1 Tax=Bombardia bombarda TaxID=252184 RepID=A0AA39X050_9PEZI|nr:hypothetical protein B0T17DRAFT_616979 [Bombardia bombarda]
MELEGAGLNLSVEQASQSPLRFRHGCIAVKGSKVIGQGYNDHRSGYHSGRHNANMCLCQQPASRRRLTPYFNGAMRSDRTSSASVSRLRWANRASNGVPARLRDTSGSLEDADGQLGRHQQKRGSNKNHNHGNMRRNDKLSETRSAANDPHEPINLRTASSPQTCPSKPKPSPRSTNSRPCYRCVSYMVSVGIKRVFWTNGEGRWECAKVRDLVDLIEGLGTSHSKSRSSREGAEPVMDVASPGVFVIKHEVLMLGKMTGL